MGKQFMVRGTPIGFSAVGLVVFCSMGGLLFGYDTGQIAVYLPLYDVRMRFGEQNAQGEYFFTDVRSGLIVGLLSIGTLIGALVGSPISDRLGRRNATSIGALVVAIGCGLQMASTYSWVMLAVTRLVGGLGVGALSANIPLYQAELSPKEIRGSLVASYQLFITIGILIAYCIGLGTRNLPGADSWRLLIGLGIVFCAILGFGIQTIPESPRWLFQHGREDEARAALCRIRGVPKGEYNPHVEKDFLEMRLSLEEDAQRPASSWAECFGPRLRKRTFLGMAMQMWQQLTGANYFFYYGATIFAGVGIPDSFVTQAILGAVNVVTTLPGLWFLERFGRRRTLICGAAWQSAWLFVFAIAGTVRDPAQNQGIAYLMIVAACLFIAGFASTWGPGTWVAITEMNPQHTRARQNAIATATNWLFNFLLAFCTPFIVSRINYSYGFVFAVCNMLACLTVLFFLKEGNGLSLEQIQALWSDPVTALRSRKWAPPGFSSRQAAIDNEDEKEKTAIRGAEERFEHSTPVSADQSIHSSDRAQFPTTRV